ncbi:MAG TPA: tRNA (adenosine(37)-N6)-threonylcarbamoyltransferase complex ATPase subunit type 1 TsaE [Aestuariivirgaceae bacterium]|nr:tRNA (adenosine(37)-N6)-threonylcarbamoyltransferase complex ATPase subunit type 1 TsaE [Aestuariivirgaceae bacterium]
MSKASLSRILPDETATAALGAELSLVARTGDVVLLDGDLGAGKTTLARGFIRALHPGEPSLEVPSPTFSLVQTYDGGRLPVAHLDLYRIRTVAELDELGIDDLGLSHLLLVEWPALLSSTLPADRLTVRLTHAGDGRRAELVGEGSWASRLARLEAARTFLAAGDWKDAERRYFEGDASTRRYERLRCADRCALLMDMPARTDGPPVRDGKPYSAIAHLAEDVRSVVAVTEMLIARGLSAARIFDRDMEAGFLVIEDLGDRVYGRMMRTREDVSEAMTMAVTLLADMAAMDWPDRTRLPDGRSYELPHYDAAAMEIEAELLLDWFWPLALSSEPGAAARSEFLAAWRRLWPLVLQERKVWTLRDYHSPNLLWLPDRAGTARVGVIDTQDAVLGHPAYDLASLLQDARIHVAEATASDLLDYYCAYREATSPDFEQSAFRDAFVVLGTQRLTKILGIFARLARRDGKPVYLKNVGILNRYLEANLRHPVLAELKRWYDSHLPLAVREAVAAR